jgi:dipeptidyl-peptidase-3
MLEGPPFVVGYPSDSAQSAYYPGEQRITKEEITRVSNLMLDQRIEPENTRIRKVTEDRQTVFEVLQASTDPKSLRQWDNVDGLGTIRVRGGDHADELSRVCASLLLAKEYVENETQAQVIDHYTRNFQTGDMEAFRDAQKVWVKDKAPVIESVMGFVEPYRDPHGVRGEWEGFVGISDPVESTKMRQFVDQSKTFIRLLPWAVPDMNDDKGPFEKDIFVAPDYTSSYCTLPNFCIHRALH